VRATAKRGLDVARSGLDVAREGLDRLKSTTTHLVDEVRERFGGENGAAAGLDRP
jgi:hypothetical protein